jgi:hypothetical protein
VPLDREPAWCGDRGSLADAPQATTGWAGNQATTGWAGNQATTGWAGNQATGT